MFLLWEIAHLKGVLRRATLPPFTAGTGTAGQRCFSPWGKCFCDSPQNLFHRLSIAYTTIFSVQKKLHLKGVLRRTTLLLFTSGTETEMLFHPGESCFAIPPGFTLGDIHCCSLRSRPNTWYGSACWQFLTGWVRNWQFRTEVGSKSEGENKIFQ